jgi:predicted extracellular nuclease
LNSYAREDPIQTLLNGGFQSAEPLSGVTPPVYSYLFDGQFGTLGKYRSNNFVVPTFIAIIAM